MNNDALAINLGGASAAIMTDGASLSIPFAFLSLATKLGDTHLKTANRNESQVGRRDTSRGRAQLVCRRWTTSSASDCQEGISVCRRSRLLPVLAKTVSTAIVNRNMMDLDTDFVKKSSKETWLK